MGLVQDETPHPAASTGKARADESTKENRVKLSDAIESGEWREMAAREAGDDYLRQLRQHEKEIGVPHPDAGRPFRAPNGTLLEGYVVGCCGHRVAESEWRAGFKVCERCPAGEY